MISNGWNERLPVGSPWIYEVEGRTRLIFLCDTPSADNIGDDLCSYILANLATRKGSIVKMELTTGSHCTDTDPKELGICLIVLDVAINDGTHSCLFHIPFSVVGPPIWPTRWILVGTPHLADAPAQTLSETCFDSPYPWRRATLGSLKIISGIE